MRIQNRAGFTMTKQGESALLAQSTSGPQSTWAANTDVDFGFFLRSKRPTHPQLKLVWLGLSPPHEYPRQAKPPPG